MLIVGVAALIPYDYPQRMANLLSKVRYSVLRRKKRRRSAASEEGQVVKKRRKGSASVTEDSLEEGRIAAFVEWCEEVGITLHPKVCWSECVAAGAV